MRVNKKPNNDNDSVLMVKVKKCIVGWVIFRDAFILKLHRRNLPLSLAVSDV